jgi:hypothetical protein
VRSSALRVACLVLSMSWAAACGGDEKPTALETAGVYCEPTDGVAGSGAPPKRGSRTAWREDDTIVEPEEAKPTRSASAGRTAAGAGGSSAAANADDEPEQEPEAEPETPAKAPQIPAGVDCPDPSSLVPDQKISGNLRSGDSLWTGVVEITGNVEVYDSSVTIEAGTVILVDKGAGLVFGSLGEATLTAKGTATKPIRFCGSDLGPGHWAGVSLASLSGESTFEHVLIDGAGSAERALGISGEVAVKNLRVRNSGADGIHAVSFSEESDDWVIEGTAGAPVVLNGVAAVTRFPKNVMFLDNNKEYAVVRIPVLTDEELIFHDIGLPYLQDGDFLVEGYGGSKLTMEAGVDYQVGVGRKFDVHAVSTKTSELKIQGTEAKPVSIRGSESTKGHWFGMTISLVTPASQIAHLIISDAGREGAYALQVESTLVMQDVTVKNSEKGALFEAAPAMGSENFSAIGNGGYGLEIVPGVITSLPEGGVIENNELDMIAVRKGTLSPGTVKNLGVPYRAEALQLDGMLEIEAGTELVFAKGAGFTVGQYNAPGLLEALGTSSKQITFRGEDNANGSWAGLKISNAAADGCELSYVNLTNAGLTLAKAATVTNSSFKGSATFGITKPAGDMTDYTDTNTFSNNVMGNVSP